MLSYIILCWCIFIWSFNFSKLIKKNLDLNKKFTKDIDKVMNVKRIKIEECTNDNISEKLNSKYKEKIIKYKKKVIEATKNVDMSNMYRNLSNLKIESKKILINASGNYTNRTNKIRLKEETALSHEFLHMCSSYYTKKINACGFKISKKNKELGRAINEGYTSLLDSKLYSSKPAYFFEFRIASIIEQIISEDKMIKFYFENDLYSLIESLSIYVEKNNVKKMFKYMDIILEYKQLNKNEKKMYEDIIYKLAKNVNKIIDEITINSLNHLTDIEKFNFLKIRKQNQYFNIIDPELNLFKGKKCIINEETNNEIELIFNKCYDQNLKNKDRMNELILKLQPLTKNNIK